MQLVTITIIALGLAMDAFAVAIVSGSTYKKLRISHAFRIALFFGAFQALMPLIGSLAGMTIKQYIERYDHWVAFGLLSTVGFKMIYESFKIESAQKRSDPSGILTLLVLSVATSIDALAVGITLPFLRISILLAVIIIGLITFFLSYIGVIIGKRLGRFFEGKIEAVGGLVLIFLGIKILLEHLLV